MTEKGLISVIIPVYNTAVYLPRCLDSVLSQDYDRLEVIAVDDGSSDGSGAVCDGYAARDSRVRVIHKANGGVSSARNAGLDAAAGDLIAFCDSDDYLPPETYGILAGALEEHGADISVCAVLQNCDGTPHGEVRTGGCTLMSRGEMIVSMLKRKPFDYAVNNVLYRHDVLDGVRFDTSLSHNEDLLFNYEAMKRAGRGVFCDFYGYIYCINEGSAVHSAFSGKMMTAIDAQERLLNDIRTNLPQLAAAATGEFVTVNLFTAQNAVRDGYSDRAQLRRMRRNVGRHLMSYLRGGHSRGYKLLAAALTAGYPCFRAAIAAREKRKNDL